MAFDINTAKPVKTGFDISTAKPVNEGPQPISPYGGIEGAKRFGIGGPIAYFTQPGSEDVLPAVGQIAGGIIPGVNAFGGSVAGATVGQAARQGIRRVRGNNVDYGAIATEPIKSAASELVGRGVSKMLEPAAGKLMNLSLGVGKKLLQRFPEFGTDAAKAGYFGSLENMEGQAAKNISGLEDKIQGILSSSKNKADVSGIFSKLDDMKKDYFGNPQAIQAIEDMKDSITKEMPFGSHGKLPIQKVNDLKRSLYSQLKETNYGTGEVPASVAIRKKTANVFKNAIEQAEPDQPIAEINKQLGFAGNVKKLAESKAASESRRGLPFWEYATGVGSLLTGHPAGLGAVAGWEAARNPGVQSLTAQALIQLAKQKALGRATTLGATEAERRLFGN